MGMILRGMNCLIVRSLWFISTLPKSVRRILMNRIGVHSQKNFFVSNLDSQVVARMEKKRLVFTSRNDAEGDLHKISYGQGQAFFSLKVIDTNHSVLASVRPHDKSSTIIL